MKFLAFTMYDNSKAMAVAEASDKASKIPGQKLLAAYLCMGKPFDGVPPNTVVAVTLRETDSSEAMLGVGATLANAGATIWAVPVMELPAGSTVAEAKKYAK